MPDLRVSLLGPPEVLWQGRPLPIPRRVPRALLYYLAGRGGPVGRSELTTLFWEELPDTVARQRFRETLSRLRTALPDPDLIHREADLVGLDFERVYVDQLHFLELVDPSRRLPLQSSPKTPLPEPYIQQLTQAAGLWRGTRFLAGADLPSSPGLDAWQSLTGRYLEHLYVGVLQRLAQHAYAVGELEKSLQLSRLALINDELNEDLHALALRCLIDLGNRGEANEYYLSVRELLNRELDARPGPELEEVYRHLRGDEHRNGTSAAGRAGAADPGLQRWNLRSGLQAPFVGRERDLRQLQRSYQSGGGMFIFGESGQGKTRLLQEFSARLHPAPRLLLSQCRPAEKDMPFQPVIDLLRTQVRPEEWEALPPAWAGQLIILLPELVDLRPELARPPVDFTPDVPLAARAHLLEAIRQVILLIARQRPLILFLDDAHWADEASLATVAYLLERPPFDHRALLVVAARREEKNPFLDNLLPSLRLSPQVQVLVLKRFSLAETAELTQRILGEAPPPTLVQRLGEETGGNPLFILETLHALLLQRPDLEGSPANLESVHLPLAESLQGQIRTRLGLLRPASRQVLEVAAVIGNEFDPQVVAEVLGKQRTEPGDKLVDLLEDLVQRVLIEPLSSSPTDLRYRFIHSKIREALLEEIPPLKQRQLHYRVGRALEERLGRSAASQAAVLARHFENGGDLAAAFRYWVSAGRRARQLVSPVEADQAFSRAEALLSQAPDLDDEQMFTLFNERLDMAYENEDAAALERLTGEMLRLGQDRDSPLLIGAALDGMSDLCLVSNRFEAGLETVDRALPYLQESGNLFKHMEALNHRGVFLYMLNRIGPAMESFQAALEVGGSNDRLVMRARANSHYHLAVACTLNGWPEISLDHASLALADFKILNRLHGQVTAFSALALSRYFLGQYTQAREDSQAGIELAERIGAWRMLGYLHAYRAMIEMVLGEADAALVHAGQAVELGERYGHGETAGAGERIFGDIFLGMQAYALSIPYYERSLQLSQNSFFTLDPEFRLGLCLCRTGQMEAGQFHMNRAIELAERSGLGIVWVMAKLCQANIYPLSGNWDGAASQAALVIEETQQRKMPMTELMAVMVQGEVALQRGDPAQACELFKSAVGRASELESPWVEIRARLHLERAQRARATTSPDQRESILDLLAKLDSRTTQPLIRPAFEQYTRWVREEISDS